jgi:hypothetical protein
VTVCLIIFSVYVVVSSVAIADALDRVERLEKALKQTHHAHLLEEE